MAPGEPREQHRSRLVEAFCPYARRKILGLVTYHYVPDPEDGGLRRQRVRAECLLREQCEELGCVLGAHPLDSVSS